ncbi:hypothetical protein DFP72DRAFT_925843 [Ephemerocybe angulata]|uniref:F-box domain-containing protein n=1 Tax=Ephemerocybe angulata TaxID=980116 RepID=A0A8H6HFJ1_9AGAR|nr:hypothetical protein DFP72DRAFT_925843 [Tulosesus angulatus]
MSAVCLLRVLLSNDVPDTAEVGALKKENVELKREARKLRMALGEIEARIDQRNGALSAIRRVPLEVLGQIFTFTLGAPTPLDEGVREELLNLGRVCQKWRDASLLTHELWSGVSVHPRNLRGSYDKIETWLSRAGSVPKSLHLLGPFNGHGHLASATTLELLTRGPPLDHLYFESERIGDLEEFMYYFALNHTDVPNRPWDNLRSLAITIEDQWIQDMWWFDAEDPSTSIFSYLPPVTSFSLHLPKQDMVFPDDDSEMLRLNIPPAFLGRLTSLEVACDWDGPHILVMLQHCKNLEQLVVDVINSQAALDEAAITRQPFPRTGILLPKLRVLHLQRYTADLRILDYLVTPALTDLDIEMDGYELLRKTYPKPFVVDSIKDLQKRSNSQDTVRSLRLYNVHLAPKELVRILAVVPSLTHLTLDRVKFATPGEISGFWRSLNNNKCLAHAQRLEVLRTEPAMAEDLFDSMLEFLVERGKGKRCEVTVSFQGATIPTESDARRAWGWIGKDKDMSMEEFGLDFRVVWVPAVADEDM